VRCLTTQAALRPGERGRDEEVDVQRPVVGGPCEVDGVLELVLLSRAVAVAAAEAVHVGVAAIAFARRD